MPLYTLKMTTDHPTALQIEATLADIEGSFSMFEITDPNTTPCRWDVAIVVEDHELTSVQSLLSPFHHHVEGYLESPVDTQINWLEATHHAFPPLTIGSFYIYGSHHSGPIPTPSRGLCVDAATAFGSGEHPTTEGCILALEALHHQGLQPQTLLDLGCGSGILSLVAKTLWPEAAVWAVDNDPEAIRVTGVYAQRNSLELVPLVSNGFDDPALSDQVFDVTVANILANPLIDLAPLIAQHTRLYVIVSGILITQATDVITAYHNQGLTLASRHDKGDWTCLTLCCHPAL